MKISYDQEVDALSIVFRETPVTTKPLGDPHSASVVTWFTSARVVSPRRTFLTPS